MPGKLFSTECAGQLQIDPAENGNYRAYNLVFGIGINVVPGSGKRMQVNFGRLFGTAVPFFGCNIGCQLLGRA